MSTGLRRTIFAVLILLPGILPETPAPAGQKPAWSPTAAAAYLDGRAKWWQSWPSAARGQGTACISCHTTLPFALARPALGEPSAGGPETVLIDNVKKRVANWDKIVAENTTEANPFRPFYANERKPSALGTESVVNALALVNHDLRRAKGVLSEPTRTALAHLWQQQQPDGAWLWLDFGLSPWEADARYYGASLAALAVGMAGQDYYERPDVQPRVVALKKFLAGGYAKQRLHHRMTALWASSRLPGVIGDQDREKLIAEILTAQNEDGSWSLARLGQTAPGQTSWTLQGSTRPGGGGDGYATGLAVLTLKSAGLGADQPKLKWGIDWLIAQQNEGTWPAAYLNKSRDPESDTGKFMRDAGTAFAVLALTESP